MEFIYKIRRKVVHGKKRGKDLGFPTANLNFYKRDEYLEDGSYVVTARLDKKTHKGIAHIGKTKTFSDIAKIEVHLFNCSKSFYGNVMEVKFIKKIRKTKKFHNKELLADQIKRDKTAAVKYFNNR